jgi:predicted DNA-binding transcriptional regulator YafY
MGSRSQGESISRLILAFLEKNDWTQAELARRLELTTKRTSQLLRLVEADLELTRSEEPPHVYWSVRRGWFLGRGQVVTHETTDLLARLLARLPSTADRDRALKALLRALPEHSVAAREGGPDAATTSVLHTLEDAARQKSVARIRYFSASRGDTDDRAVSIHRLRYRGVVSFVATCHRADALRWFRADCVERALVDSSESFREVDPGELTRFLETSVGGFRRDDEPVEQHVCFVRDPEARWVKRNLPEGAVAEIVVGGVRLKWRAAAVLPLARFVVGLGDAAVPESPALRQRVVDLARGALAAAEGKPLRMSSGKQPRD